MKYHLSLLLLLISIFSFSQEKAVIRVYNSTDQEIVDMTKKVGGELIYMEENHHDVVASQEMMAFLEKQKIPFEILQTSAEIKHNLSEGKQRGYYQSYEEVLEILQDLAAENPGICTLTDMGDTWGKTYYNEGNDNYMDFQHDLWVLKLSDNVENEEDEPNILIDAAHHAREPISVEVCLYLLQHLIAGYDVDPEITAIINSNQLWFVPLINPNGHKIVTDEIDIWWRKNIRDNNKNGIIDPAEENFVYRDGVDPNRNYSFEWGYEYSCTGPYRDQYRGPHPFSEPNTMMLKDLLSSHHFIGGLSYHSYGERVMYPWGYNSMQPHTPDHVAYKQLATNIGNAIPKLSSGHYVPFCTGEFTTLTGISTDYNYGEHGGFFYTLELAQDFIPPVSEIDQICEDNIDGAMVMLTRAQHSILTGHVTSSESRLPIEAVVSIEGIDNQPTSRKPIKSDLTFGTYYRLLVPGTYDVTFSAFGYEAQTFNDIEIYNDQPTLQEVELIPANPVQINGTVYNLDDGLPVNNAHVIILNTPVDTISTGINGEFQIQDIYPGEYQFEILASGFFVYRDILTISSNPLDQEFLISPVPNIGFESEDEVDYFKMSGHQPWSRTDEYAYEGLYSFEPGNISAGKRSVTSCEVYFEQPFELYYDQKVSCDSACMGLIFASNQHDLGYWMGELDWINISYQFEVGVHLLEWSFSRQWGTPSGLYLNTAFIDNIKFSPQYVSTETIESKNPDISIFPNPAKDHVNISFILPKPQTIDIQMYSLEGKLITKCKNENMPAGQHQIRIDLNASENTKLPNGAYFIRIDTETSKTYKKIIITSG